MSDPRNTNGRFAPGNPGGPGRPRRAVEREYLAALLDKVTLADWSEIVDRALADAKAGDAKARNWLARFLLGEKPLRPLDLAADEQAGVTVDSEIETNARNRQQNRMFNLLGETLRDDLANAMK